jgi:hypothetical protein
MQLPVVAQLLPVSYLEHYTVDAAWKPLSVVYPVTTFSAVVELARREGQAIGVEE